MDGPQQDERPALQHFFQWLSKARQQGNAGTSVQFKRPFLPYPKIKDYLSDRWRVQSLLKDVFLEPDPARYPNIKDLQESYCRVFCILICIGQGRFINQLIQHSLDDQHLPFETQPNHFPFSTSPFWPAFYNQQWEFCAPTFKYNMDRHFDAKEYVLPIVEKKELRRGGSGASTYRIVLHEAYDELHPDHRKGSDPRQHKKNVYVLKTYRTRDAERYYHNEVGGFKRLRFSGDKPCPQIIGFYGSFVRNDTYNILLEYADKGTLEDYFENTPPPCSGPDIVTFWTGLLYGVFGALQIIHNTGRGDSGGSPIFYGWHQDMKPANILVTTCKDGHEDSGNDVGCLYKANFKVADLGLSHFIRTTVPSEEITDKDARGTRTYGAPECCRDHVTEESPLSVKQDVDVWSLGCVLSEAAVWVTKGYTHVLRYRQERSVETDNLDEFDEGDCFHDGYEVLKTVAQAHQNVLKGRRPKDHVTKAVIKLVENHMLVEAKQRLSAKQLYLKAKKIIKNAKTKLCKEPREDTVMALRPPRSGLNSLSRSDSHPLRDHDKMSSSNRLGNGSRQRKETSNIFVSGMDDISPTESKLPYRLRSDASMLNRTLSLDSLRALGQEYDDLESTRPMSPPQLMGRMFNRTLSLDSLRTLGHEDDDRDSATLSSRPRVNSPHQHRPPSDPAFIRASVGYYDQDRTISHGKRRMPSSGQSQDYQHRLGSSIESNARNVIPIYQPSPDSNHPAQAPLPAAPPQVFPRQPRPSSELLPLNPPAYHLGLQNLDAAQTKNVHRESSSWGPPPFLGFEHAMRWRRKKKLGIPASLPDKWLLGDLKDRDCAFLVDDASSMKPYWSNVIQCLGLLGYIVKSTGKYGFEVYFTMLQKPGKTKKLRESTSLMVEAERRELVGQSNMKEALGRILQEYKNYLDKCESGGIRGHKKVPRRYNLYILTDLVWQECCDVEPIIRDMVDTLRKRGLYNSQVGIQFIQFGQNREGAARLNQLNSKMNPKLEQIMVDNEPFKGGNVWKMLLGSTNKWFDQDPVNGNKIHGSSPSTNNHGPHQ